MTRPRRRREAKRVELCITSLLDSGEGTTAEGVAVAGALPGERVVARVEAGRGTVVEVLEPHPDRVTPACAIADRCGGCDWMGARPALQRELLAARLTRLFPRGGEVEVEQVGPSLAYRSRARLLLRAAGQVHLGYRRSRSHRLVDTRACPVLRPELEAALPLLRDVFSGAHGEGEVQLALGAQGRPVLDVRWRGADPAVGPLARPVEDGRWAGLRLWLEDATRPLVFGDARPVMTGVDGAPLYLAPGGFGQPSDEAGLRLATVVRDAVSAHEARRCIELFAGSGTLTVGIAPLVEDLTAVEVDDGAAAQLRHNLETRGIEHAKVVAAEATQVRLGGVDTVVLDPPRSGAPAVVPQLLRSGAKTIVYVSCEPRTLAADVAALADRYTLVALRGFQIFAHTHHVETVAVLARNG